MGILNDIDKTINNADFSVLSNKIEELRIYFERMYENQTASIYTELNTKQQLIDELEMKMTSIESDIYESINFLRWVTYVLNNIIQDGISLNNAGNDPSMTYLYIDPESKIQLNDLNEQLMNFSERILHKYVM